MASRTSARAARSYSITCCGRRNVAADRPAAYRAWPPVGSNHVLPTGGQARYSAGLSAATFLRPQQVIEYDRAALAEVRDAIVALAEAEQLPAHGEAVAARFEG